ncbi:Hypothetical predicted protein [Mytilus galloprovincialis]|uniref:Uncharacterized protein n=1 Tax=Mytilus galloprovincialis TaxID=29158 RepID=A0A8B6CJT1_MYTGA|nr:Hypothetical predicted protein [Mytilus galloprovincialis]
MKHDIVIARDSSDSSDDSDKHRRRFIKKLKRRLSRRKRIKLRRRNANVLIEKLIKEKILRTKNEPNKNTKSDKMEPRIHNIDKGNQNVKPLTKSSLIKTLGERLLSDYDYTTITPNGKESTGPVVSWDGIFTANENVQSSTKSEAVGNLGHSFIKTSSPGSGVSTSPKPNANTNAEQEFEGEIETEEQVITTTKKNIFSTSKQINEEQEIEAEETTTQNIISTIRPLASSTASSNNGEQEIEAEETTTINSITTVKSHLSKSTAAGEQEVEIEGITSTTKTSVTQQTLATVDQEVEAEETTTPLYSTSTKTLVSSINDHQPKQRVIDNAVANKYHGIAGIYIKPKSLDKPQITAQITGATRQKTEIPLNNGNFSYITKGELSISGKTLPLDINSVNSKSILNKDANGHSMGSERKIDMNSIIRHPQKALGSYHPPVPAEEAVVSVPGDASVISSLDKNILQTKTTLGKVGSGRRRVDDNGKPSLKNPADLNSTAGLRSIGSNTSEKETLKFSGNVFKIQPSLNVHVRTTASKDKKDKTSRTPLSAHSKPISTIPSNSNSFVAPTKLQETIHTIRINGQSKPATHHIVHGTSRSNMRHISLSGKDNFKLQKHGITYLQPTIEVVRKNGKTPNQQTGNGVAAKLNKKTISTVKNQNNLPQISDGRRSSNFILNNGGNASGKTMSQEPHNKTFIAGRRTSDLYNNAHPQSGYGVAFKLNKNTISGKRTLNNLPQINNGPQSSIGILNVGGNASGQIMLQKLNDKTVTDAGRNDIKQVSLGPTKSLTPFLPNTAPFVNANENTRNAKNQNQNWKPVVHSISIMNEIHTIGSKDTGLDHTPKINSISKSIQIENRSGIKPKKLSWQHRATSKPVVQQKAFVNNPPNPLPIAWGPVATSNTVVKEKKLGTTDIQGQQQKSWGPMAAGKSSLNKKDTNVEIGNDIQWGPVAKSKPSLGKKNINTEIGNNIQWGPVATSKPASINYIQTHKNISWGPVATSIPVVTGQQMNIQDKETNIDASRQQISNNGQGSSHKVATDNILNPSQITTSHISGLSRGLLDQLRQPSMRNLGSNRGRLTIMDAGNSSNVLPMPNGKAKDQIQNKIKADEILTSKWLDSKRKEATVLATELGGIWKGLSPGTKRQNVNKSERTRGTVPMSTTGIDPITFRWSPTWT